MTEELKNHISETCGSEFWEPITCVLWQGYSSWQLFKFENDILFDDSTWRCVLIRKDTYDSDVPDAVDYSEVIFAEAWVL